MSETKDKENHTDIDESRRAKISQRDAIIMAALQHIPFDGWSDKALIMGAESIEISPSSIKRFFPGGVKDALTHFIDLADRKMVEDLAAYDLPSMKIRERISIAVRLRLQRWTPYREPVRRALALSPLTPFTGGVLRGWYKTVDVIWRAAGDKSIDFNFYTKRGLLAAVYGATLLYWLDDKSEDCKETWAFLDRRIADVMKVPKIKKNITERIKNLPYLGGILERIVQRRAPKPH